jgi:hypothetical protein
VLLSVVGLAHPARAQDAADRAAIRQAALDYIEGWYTGDAARMDHAVHPELAKRIVRRDPATGVARLDHQSAMTLIENTRAGGGRRTPEARRLKEVTVLDVYRNAASVKVVAAEWIDYLHVVRWNNGWRVINVLWELKPEQEQ